MLLVGSSCSSDKQGSKKAVTAKVQSAPYELLVVADKEWLSTEVGQELKELMETPIEGLPQIEGNFRVTYINPRDFKGTFKTYGNIVFVEIATKHENPMISVLHNTFARPQVLVNLLAPDNKTFATLLQQEGGQVLDILNENESTREKAFLEKHNNGKVSRTVEKMFGVSINVPKDIDDMKQGERFLWASASNSDFKKNVCLYTLPLQSLTEQRWVEVRDSVMKVNIPGGRKDQWMETDSRTVSVRMMKVGGQEVLTMRGLWDMRHDAMGGPFVCYAYPDTLKGCILVAEGFVFAPEEKKRPIIRQMEAALQTVFFVPGTHK